MSRTLVAFLLASPAWSGLAAQQDVTALPAAVTALQRTLADVTRRTAPGVVTLRAYVRTPAAGGGAAAPAPVRAAAVAAPAAVAPELAPVPGAAAAARPGGWLLPAAPPDHPGFELLAACSGFVVREDGEILSCNHALRREDGSLPDLIEIETHDNARLFGELVGAEPTVNMAILQATVFPNGHPRKLAPLAFGDSEQLLPGEQLLAVGDPAGPERFLALATFVALPNRDCYQDLLSAFFLQVGMVAHPEAYGGPLVNLRGEVVGILAPRQVAFGAWRSSPRLGVEFGLPSKVVAELHEAIRSVRSFRSPWLGFAVMSRPELAAARGIAAFEALPKPRNGILVENVFEPGPAFAAGIRPGDFLVQFGDTRIFTPVDFQRCLYLTGIGGTAKLELWRDGATLHRELAIEQRPPEATPR
jgi:S1-C subfamily serine protease